LSEVIKHALIADEKLFALLEELQLHSNVRSQFNSYDFEIMKSAISVKSKIVEMDPYEKNERKFLNFGHTIGHALESYSIKHDSLPISHGEAVASGMICELYLSNKYCGFSSEELVRSVNLIKSIFEVLRINKSAFSELTHLVKADKKSHAGKIDFALLKKIGVPVLFNGVSEECLYEAFHFYNEN
jgi:3-dehydroquinate synthase